MEREEKNGKREHMAENMYDAIIIGGGPAGLTGAIYLARAKHKVLLIEKDYFGGQISITSEVVNYPGIEQTGGMELTETMRNQAESFGAEFLMAEVESIGRAEQVEIQSEEGIKGDTDICTEANADGNAEGNILKEKLHAVHTSKGTYYCRGVLLATGARPRLGGFAGEKEFKGHGISYCATCDGGFFTGKEVFVIGSGFAAAEESVFLTKFARHVTILIRGNDFTCAKSVADAARANEKITILINVEVVAVEGDKSGILRSITYRNRMTGEETTYQVPAGEAFGVFVFVGYEPASELLKDIAALDLQGYVLTDENGKTTSEGIYAAGDVCAKNLRQVATAVGDGASAATALEKYLAGEA